MEAKDINHMLFSTSDFLYCTYELILKNEEPLIIIFVDTMEYYQNLRDNNWSYVEEKDWKKYKEDHDRSVEKIFNGNNVIYLKVFKNSRLSSQ